MVTEKGGECLNAERETHEGGGLLLLLLLLIYYGEGPPSAKGIVGNHFHSSSQLLLSRM